MEFVAWDMVNESWVDVIGYDPMCGIEIFDVAWQSDPIHNGNRNEQRPVAFARKQ